MLAVAAPVGRGAEHARAPPAASRAPEAGIAEVASPRAPSRAPPVAVRARPRPRLRTAAAGGRSSRCAAGASSSRRRALDATAAQRRRGGHVPSGRRAASFAATVGTRPRSSTAERGRLPARRSEAYEAARPRSRGVETARPSVIERRPCLDRGPSRRPSRPARRRAPLPRSSTATPHASGRRRARLRRPIVAVDLPEALDLARRPRQLRDRRVDLEPAADRGAVARPDARARRVLGDPQHAVPGRSTSPARTARARRRG